MPLMNSNADVSCGASSLILALFFIYIHMLFMQAAKALTSLHIYTDSPKPSLLTNRVRASPASLGCGP